MKKIWKSEEEWRPSRNLGEWKPSRDQLEYWEESWEPEETYGHTDSSERPPDNAGVKN